MEEEKYGYKEWWEGKVYLDTCKIVFPPDSNVGVETNLAQFSKTDALKIKRKQEELFKKQRDKKLKEFINTFNRQFKNSDAKDIYLEREFADVSMIIDGNPFLTPRFFNWNFSINSVDFSEMKRYVKEQIIQGEVHYDFIHSPNYPFQSHNKIPPEIYARVCWDYHRWLKNFVDSLNKKYSNADVNNQSGLGKSKEKLNVPIIALLHFYYKKPINRVNCSKIAAKYGYNSKNSGEGLFQDYTKYSKKSNRVGIDDSVRKNETRQNNLIKVVKLLKGQAKIAAQEELSTLEKKIQDLEI